jgi:hypothetical protein
MGGALEQARPQSQSFMEEITVGFPAASEREARSDGARQGRHSLVPPDREETGGCETRDE